MRIHAPTLEDYRHLLGVASGQAPASLWFKNAHFLNVYTGQVEQGHIYVAGKRIAYLGNKQLPTSAETEVVELEQNQLLVPGYIEPHAHPCQMYNPLSWGEGLLRLGTCLSINDNVTLLMLLAQNAIRCIEELDAIGDPLWLWWCTFDSRRVFVAKDTNLLNQWATHPLVLQGGEFVEWSAFLNGDPDLVRAMFTLKTALGKRVEGHLPGASADTLNALTAAGIGADHESLTGKDIYERLRLGLYTTLRYSSIRPDLPDLLAYLKTNPLSCTRMMLTSDGPAPFFVRQSSCAHMIQLVIQAGFQASDAYRMATLNPATYYGLDEDIGGIAPGRLACINVIESLDNPFPTHVMQEGKWVVSNQQRVNRRSSSDQLRWLKKTFPPKRMNMQLRPELIKETSNIGVEIRSNVITRAYTFSPESSLEADECYLSLIDARGEWRTQTRLKGFSKGTLALASTYSASTDILLLGREKEAMCEALNMALDLGGGIVVFFEDGEQYSIPLPLGGIMSLEDIEQLGTMTAVFTQKMQAHGHPFDDPAYTLLFLTATHLPYVRLTPEGIYLIKERRIVPSFSA